jgi:acetyltransferase-like isoleucine patch superfamily enzyme
MQMNSLSILKEIDNGVLIIRDGVFSCLVLATDSNSPQSSFTFLEDIKYLDIIEKNVNISAVVCTQEIYSQIKHNNNLNKAIAVHENPKKLFFMLHNYLYDNTAHYLHHDLPTEIGENTTIHPTVIIADNGVKIGSNCVIEPYTVIHSGVEIGNNTLIKSHCSIGGEGFQFVKSGTSFFPVRHTGNVVIGNDVHIYSNCVIDKAVFGKGTLIDNNTIVDCHVYIAHGGIIGKTCIIGSHSIILGRAVIGNMCKIGAGSTIRNGVVIGEKVVVSPRSFVTTNINDGETVTGYFAVPHSAFLENFKSSYGFS